jgi:hypothetical protein
MTTQVSGGGFTFSVESVGGVWTWDVVVSNIPNLGQTASIKNIRSPYGPTQYNNCPIPSDVVVGMSESLVQFQQQLNPRLTAVSATGYSLTITEGDPSQELSELILQNSGAFGSFMSVFSSPNSPWLTSIPSVVNGVGKGSQCHMTPKLNPVTMLASSSPYSGHINYQDNANPANVVSATFSVVVLPRPVFSLSATSVALSYSLSGTVGSSGSVTVTNSGPATSSLTFTSSKLLNQSAWLTLTPDSGSNIPQSGYVVMLFTLNQSQVPSVPGIYSDTIRLTSKNASNSPQDITVTLTVSA